MKLPLNRLLKWQVIYLILGVGYNLVSWYLLIQTGKGLSATDPMSGLIVMLIYGSFLIPGLLRKLGWYRILMVIAIGILGYGGIIGHILEMSQSLEGYYSLSAALLAIGINVFGLIWNVFAALGWYEKP